MPSASWPEICVTLNPEDWGMKGKSPASRQRYLRVARSFVAYLEEVRADHVDADSVEGWLRRYLSSRSVDTVMRHVNMLERVLVVTPNPVRAWKTRCQESVRATLAGLPTVPEPTRMRTLARFNSFLAPDMEAFVAHKRHLGIACPFEIALRKLDRYLVGQRVDTLSAVDGPLLQTFMATLVRLQPVTRRGTLRQLRHFFRFLRRLGKLLDEPDSVLRSERAQSRHRPYIYRLKELAAILEAARGLATWKGTTAFTALHLIYACGLRVSEALRLRAMDVDLVEGALRIWHTKFDKSRQLPLGRRAVEYLRAYAAARQTRFGKAVPTAPFFVTEAGVRVHRAAMEFLFRKLCVQAGVNPPGCHPRIHDMRHAFAVHRLYKWYAEGGNPRDKLVLLSVYMGHVCISSTQYYLRLGQDVLRVAGAGLGRALDNVLDGRIDGHVQ